MSDLKKAIEAHLAQHNSGVNKQLTQLWNNWDMVMGEELAPLAYPLGRRGRTLLVGAEDNMMQQELTFYAFDMLERVNGFMGEQFFEKVQVHLLMGNAPLDEVELPSIPAPPQEVPHMPNNLGNLVGRLNPDSPVTKAYEKYLTVQGVAAKPQTDLDKKIATLWSNWPKVVGPKLAQLASPLGHERTTLILSAENHLKRKSVALYTNTILEKVNRFIGGTAFRRLKIFIMESAPQAEQPDAPPMEAPPAAPYRSGYLGTLHDKLSPNSPVTKAYNAYVKKTGGTFKFTDEQSRILLNELWNRWEMVVGPDFAHRTFPLEYHDKTIIVGITEALTETSENSLAEEILLRVNGFIMDSYFTHVRLEHVEDSPAQRKIRHQSLTPPEEAPQRPAQLGNLLNTLPEDSPVREAYTRYVARIQSELEEQNPELNAQLSQLANNWETAMGDELAPLISPLEYRGRTLVIIATDDTRKLAQLNVEAEVLLRANGFMGEEYFTDVEVEMRAELPEPMETEFPSLEQPNEPRTRPTEQTGLLSAQTLPPDSPAGKAYDTYIANIGRDSDAPEELAEHLRQMWRNWEMVMGPELAEAVFPQGCTGTTISVGVVHHMLPPMEQDLSEQNLTEQSLPEQRLKNALLERVNGFMGRPYFTEVLAKALPAPPEPVKLVLPTLEPPQEAPKRPERLGSLMYELDPDSPVTKAYKKYVSMFDTEK